MEEGWEGSLASTEAWVSDTSSFSLRDFPRDRVDIYVYVTHRNSLKNNTRTRGVS